MPYLYTLAEEASRTGLPMVRPLFLEFPDAAPDRHPIDTDIQASGEFLLGHDLLIAPSPFPDELDSYSIEFPSADWYNYWTGEKIESSRPDPATGPASVRLRSGSTFHPGQYRNLRTLPVFVHAGSILPIAPLVESTNQIPQGPLSLRVYAGDDCNGSVYQDDGRTYAYKDGAYLRMQITCQIASDGFTCTRPHRKERIQPGGKKFASKSMDGNPPRKPHRSMANLFKQPFRRLTMDLPLPSPHVQRALTCNSGKAFCQDGAGPRSEAEVFRCNTRRSRWE